MRIIYFYLRIIAALQMLFILGSFILMTFGSTQPINPTLRGFIEGCEGIPQPCWYGIVPGVTNETDATANLTARGFVVTRQFNDYIYGCSDYGGEVSMTLCVTNINGNRESNLVARISFGDSGLIVGEIFEVLGVPEGVFLGDTFTTTLIYSSKTVVYLEGDLKTFVTAAGYSRVSWMELQMTENTTPQFEWMGFAPHWRYCQVVSRSSLCPR